MQKKNVLITGGSGFIGSAIIRNLLNTSDHNIFNLSRSNIRDSRIDTENSRYTFIECDLEKLYIFDRIPKGVIDIVIHCSSLGTVDRYINEWEKEYHKMYDTILSDLSYRENGLKNVENTIWNHPKIAKNSYLKKNITITQNALEMSLRMKVDKFVNLSSAYVFGPSYSLITLPTEEFPKNPRGNGIYSISKAMCESLVDGYSQTYNLKTHNLRLPQMFGKYQQIYTLIPITVLSIMNDLTITLPSYGQDLRDWLDVDECAERIKYFVDMYFNSKSYNISSCNVHSSYDIVRLISGILGKEAIIDFQGGFQIDYGLDATKFKNELLEQRHPFEYRKYVFYEQLKKTVDFIVKNHDSYLIKMFNINSTSNLEKISDYFNQ